MALTFPWYPYPSPSYGVCPALELMVAHLKNLEENLDHGTRLWYHRYITARAFWYVGGKASAGALLSKF